MHSTADVSGCDESMWYRQNSPAGWQIGEGKRVWFGCERGQGKVRLQTATHVCLHRCKHIC